ncbi:MAG: signal peptidase I [Chloroflexales bacterium]|jgi:signal peptidase I
MPRITRRLTLSVNTIIPKPQRRSGRVLIDILKIMLFTLILLIFSTTLIARFEIEQTSMEPNFYPGQRIIVSQAERNYGSWLNGSAYAAHPGAAAAAGLQRGQIVVFYESDDQSEAPLIKRLIGVPGDRIAIHDGAVFVNRQRLSEPYINVFTDCSNYCALTLGADEYFFLGDNRPVSHDSRQFGPVPGNHVIGRVVARFWPLDQLTIFL